MAVPAGNELVVKVRIDGEAATRDVDRVAKTSATAFSRALKIEAAVLGFFFGGIARQAGAALAGLGDAIGRGTQVGETAAKFYGRIGAATTATERTTAAFGLAGRDASKQQILDLYRAFKQIEELRSDSRSRVQGVIGEERAREALTAVMRDLVFGMKNFTDVIKAWGR